MHGKKGGFGSIMVCMLDEPGSTEKAVFHILIDLISADVGIRRKPPLMALMNKQIPARIPMDSFKRIVTVVAYYYMRLRLAVSTSFLHIFSNISCDMACEMQTVVLQRILRFAGVYEKRYPCKDGKCFCFSLGKKCQTTPPDRG